MFKKILIGLLITAIVFIVTVTIMTAVTISETDKELERIDAFIAEYER